MSRFLALFKAQRWPINQVGVNMTTQAMIKCSSQNDKVILTEIDKRCTDVQEMVCAFGLIGLIGMPIPTLLLHDLANVDPKFVAGAFFGGCIHQYYLYSKIGSLARCEYFENLPKDKP